MNNRHLTKLCRIPPLGLGCWAIGGPFFSGATPVGWGEVDDNESIRAIHAGLDAGIRYFDTAQLYGTGRSEEVLGKALHQMPDVHISSKIGRRMDRTTRQIIGNTSDPDEIEDSILQSLQRLRRTRIDLVYLHVDDFSLSEAQRVFDRLERLIDHEKLGAYGWSTDYADRADSFPGYAGFQSVQFAMNVFQPATVLLAAVDKTERSAVIRAPLAMGILSGKYSTNDHVAPDDVRAQNFEWFPWFKEGRIAPSYEGKLHAVRELLQNGGRSMVQGALAWLWAASDRTIPIPGFRTEKQVVELARALEFGQLPPQVLGEINRLITMPPEP